MQEFIVMRKYKVRAETKYQAVKLLRETAKPDSLLIDEFAFIEKSKPLGLRDQLRKLLFG